MKFLHWYEKTTPNSGDGGNNIDCFLHRREKFREFLERFETGERELRGSKVVGKLAVGLGLCLTSFSGFAATNSNQVIVKFKNGYSNSKSNFARQSVSLNRVGSFNAKSQIQAFELPVGISSEVFFS